MLWPGNFKQCADNSMNIDYSLFEQVRGKKISETFAKHGEKKKKEKKWQTEEMMVKQNM